MVSGRDYRMYRAIVLAISLLVASQARSASDAYVVDFPQPAATPIVAATCDGLDLPCRPDWAPQITPYLQPLKWALSIFRFPKAPAHRGNVFAFVEVPYIEHGENDYDRLQGMIGQTGPSAERLWVHGDLGFSGADFGTQYRIARAILPSKKATDAITICVFPVLNEKMASPDRCALLAFRSENRKFLLSSIGFAFGTDITRSVPRYGLALANKNRLAETDSKSDILKSRHALEQTFDARIEKAFDQAHVFENAVATKKLDNFSKAEGNLSENSYLILKEHPSQKVSQISYQQTVQVDFQLEAGGEWRAYLADGSEESGIELLGGKQDWSVTLDWETRTTLVHSTQGSQDLRVYAFREPSATGIDITDKIRTAFLGVMKDICAPLFVGKIEQEVSTLTGHIKVECKVN